MLEAEFQQFADQGYNRIPLQYEMLADLETPLSTFLKIANLPYSYLFESVQGGEKWGRYSIIGLPCSTRLEVHGSEISLYQGGDVVSKETVDDPLAYIDNYRQTFKTPDLPG